MIVVVFVLVGLSCVSSGTLFVQINFNFSQSLILARKEIGTEVD